MTLLTLEELDVSSNVIYILNEDSGNLINLRKLMLNSNKLAALPKSIKYGVGGALARCGRSTAWNQTWPAFGGRDGVQGAQAAAGAGDAQQCHRGAAR